MLGEVSAGVASGDEEWADDCGVDPLLELCCEDGLVDRCSLDSVMACSRDESDCWLMRRGSLCSASDEGP